MDGKKIIVGDFIIEIVEDGLLVTNQETEEAGIFSGESVLYCIQKMWDLYF